MSRLHRPKIARNADRLPVKIEGRFRLGDGEEQEALVTDLSAAGCNLRGLPVGITKAQPLTLWIGPIGPISGKPRWLKNGSVGVVFDTRLDAGSLDRLGRIGAR
jgi:hypothetical protein